MADITISERKFAMAVLAPSVIIGLLCVGILIVSGA